MNHNSTHQSDAMDNRPRIHATCEAHMLSHPGEDFLSPEEWIVVANAFELSNRELSVAVLLFQGKSRTEIAGCLQCAPGTVRVYIDRLYEKIGVTDKVGLVLRIVQARSSSFDAPPTSAANDDLPS